MAKTTITTGTCKHCESGQLMDVGSHKTQAAADDTASENCDCPKSRQERDIRKMITDAREKIKKLFGETASEFGFSQATKHEVIEYLESGAEMIARYKVSSVTISAGAEKAKLSRTSKGKIKVSRTSTKSYELLTDE